VDQRADLSLLDASAFHALISAAQLGPVTD
jgi:hypothetical protein